MGITDFSSLIKLVNKNIETIDHKFPKKYLTISQLFTNRHYKSILPSNLQQELRKQFIEQFAKLQIDLDKEYYYKMRHKHSEFAISIERFNAEKRQYK